MSKPTAATSNGADKPTGTKQLSGDTGKKYKLLVQILTSDPRYAKALADVTPPSQHDKLSDSLTNLSFEIGASLGIIKALIGLEYARKHPHPFTILRVNSIVSKMIGKYSRKVGQDYLAKLLSNLIKEQMDKPDELLEVDKARMTGEDSEKSAKVEQNFQKAYDLTQRFLDRITSKVMIDEMPRHLRAICYFMAFNGEQYKLDYEKLTLPLVSGFVLLRFIQPAIALPQQYGITSKIPPDNVRANLTLVAKILQKLANGEKFETENMHLMPFNTFIEKNQKKLFDYLGELCKDPAQVEGKDPFGDLQKTVTFEDIHTKAFDMKDLTLIHSLIYEYGYDLIVSLQTEVILTHDKRPVSIMSTETDFLALVQDLGPPPGDKVEVKPDQKPKPRTMSALFGGNKKPEEPSTSTTKKKDNLKGKTFEEIESVILERSMDHLMKNLEHFDLTDLEQARFLYLGKPTKTNLPVIYIILSRVNIDFLMQNDKLMVYVFKTLQQTFQGKYVLVADLSWADIDDELRAALYRAVASFVRLMKQELLANCQQIYILHPNFKTQQAIDDVLNIMSNDTRKTLVKIAYDWMDLSEVIEPSKIWIPFVSKKFTPLTYHLVKIDNSKKQERYMKITNESILNIDAKACTIRNEVILQKIEEIRARANSSEIVIRYTCETVDEFTKRGANYFLKEPSKTGSQIRKYTCYTEQQREIIIEAIFEAGIRSCSLNVPQSFLVDKETKRGKTQKSLLKFTLDSILNFKDKMIKSEIPYSTIQSFYIDEKDKRVMYINFMLRGKKKCYILRYDNAELMRDALLDAIKRFKFGVQIEKDLLYKKDYDTVMDRLFNSTKSKEAVSDEDMSKWSFILRIDQPCNDLKRLFKKFKPKQGRASSSVEHVSDVVVKKLGLNFKEEQIKHVITTLDKEERGFFILDDLVKNFVILRREKAMLEKRKAALQKRAAQPTKVEAKKK